MMNDDEISSVLQQFQPRPEFVSRRTITATATTPNGIKSSSSFKGKQQQKQKREFSSVQYHGHILKLSYLLNKVILLKFEVSTAKPHMTKCVFISNDAPSSKLPTLLKEICENSSSSSENGNNSNTSLFAVVSKLLLSLNNLPPCENMTNKQQTAIIRSIVSQGTPMQRRIWDLQIMLLRCAAAGRHSDTFCSPIPNELNQNGLIGELILAVTDRINSTALSTGGRILHPQEIALLGMIYSLPWTAAGLLTKSNTTQNGTLIELCLDLHPILGEHPSPRFSNLSKKHGTTKVYHGTKMENVWSILNCGLWSLSYTKFCKHGSMMGSGIYFSTSHKVASHFATNEARNSTNSGTFQKAWWHLSLMNLLNLKGMSVLDDYVISCFPVFEAEIILPPKPDGTNAGNDKGDYTRRNGNYFVVPNSWDIRITKLHLTIELAKKTPMSLFLVTVVIGIIVIGWMQLYSNPVMEF